MDFENRDFSKKKSYYKTALWDSGLPNLYIRSSSGCLIKAPPLKGQFHGFARVQDIALAVVNFTVSY